MKKYLPAILLILVAQTAISQKLFFPKNNYTDSAALAENIPALARQAVEKYREPDKTTYYDNLFRLQLVAKNYVAVDTVLHRLSWWYYSDSSLQTGLGFAYRVYSSTLAGGSNRDAAFDHLYQRTFKRAFDSLNEAGKDLAANYFENDLSQLKSTYSTLLRTLGNSDSISLADAVRLCRSYCSYTTYSRTQPLAKQLLAGIDNDKYIMEDSVLVKMPDGGIISVAVVRDKKISTPQPVILMYDIYAGQELLFCKDAVKKGYIGVVADTRGKRLSPDKIEPFEHDAADAWYIIDWISKQPWCNGKVGMYGGSYLGFSQWSAVKHPHPALKTIVPQVAVAPGIDYPEHNGIFMSYMLRWLHFTMDNKLTSSADFGDGKKWQKTYAGWFTKGASFRSLDTLEGRPNDMFQRSLRHPGYDSYWQAMTPQQQEFAAINIPIFTTTGYWDDDQVGAMYYYHEYFKWNKHPDYYLLIGPYDHGGAQGYPQRQLRGYTIDSVANIKILDIIFKWFDYTLKDSSRPAILQDKVNFEVMGLNEWKHVSSLDKMHNDTLRLYLGSTAAGKRYPLLARKPGAPGYIAQQINLADRSDPRFNPDSPAHSSLIVDSLLDPQRQKLVFISDPITQPMAISGALTASIVASINKKDMDIVMELYEQTPDGRYMYLTENLQRASYARNRSKRQLLTPGKIETIPLNSTFITSRQLQKGSRIVVTMGINFNPGWQVNYGTGKDVSDETIQDAAVPMQVKWYNRSYLQLPVLK